MKNFAVTGVAGYIAPRHLQAIKDTGNNLIAAVDPHDSVGILDRYFPDVSFFTEFERFDRHLERLRRGPAENHIDYITICSPNFLHDAHIRLALRVGADAICEKPLVLNPWNLDALSELESESKGNVYTILQLRVHPSLIKLREKILNTDPKHRFKVELSYITSRGLWYHFSWKGQKEKSGGIATNIGVHFFDLLIWLFGKPKENNVHISDSKRCSGFIELERADVSWFLSIQKSDLPVEAVESGKPTFRSIRVDGEEVQFSEGFTDLHTKVYEETLAGRGFRIDDARQSIELVYKIRTSLLSSNFDILHPLAAKIMNVNTRDQEIVEYSQ
jgi:UDP-N-acetyl-2-amino-2-deoxyglucuronate dehydrogenase